MMMYEAVGDKSSWNFYFIKHSFPLVHFGMDQKLKVSIA